MESIKLKSATLYDNETRTNAIVLRSDISVEDILDFCTSNKLAFHGMGCPKDCGGSGWDDESVFRATSFSEYTTGITIKLDTVLEWKEAKASIGDPISSGGVYRHTDGHSYVTVCDAIDAGTGKRQVVYRSEDGKMFTRLWEDFFCVIKVGERLVARFVFVGLFNNKNTRVLSNSPYSNSGDK